MTETMIEKIADAIMGEVGFTHRAERRKRLGIQAARAALLAIREPHPSHVEVGMRALWAEQGVHEDHPGEQEVAAVWPAMIDAILEGKA